VINKEAPRYKQLEEKVEDPQSRLEYLLAKADELSTLATEQTEGSDKQVLPYSYTLSDNHLQVWLPRDFEDQDLLSSTIFRFLSESGLKVTTVFLSGVFPNVALTRESHNFLIGLLTTLNSDAPLSFAHTSSTIDLTKKGMWLAACNKYASKNANVPDVRCSVVPQKLLGDTSASKFLAAQVSKLRSSSSEITQAVSLLEQLMHNWINLHLDECKNVIVRNKIPWSDVLFKATSTEKVRTKTGYVTRVKVPFKPTRSPWLYNWERTYLEQILKNEFDWEKPLREAWTKLEAPSQHQLYSEYVSKLRNAYARACTLATSVNGTLGKRKALLERYMKQVSIDKSKKNILYYKAQEALKLAWQSRKGDFKESVKFMNPETYLMKIDIGFLELTSSEQKLSEEVKVSKEMAAKDAVKGLVQRYLKEFETTFEDMHVWVTGREKQPELLDLWHWYLTLSED